MVVLEALRGVESYRSVLPPESGWPKLLPDALVIPYNMRLGVVPTRACLHFYADTVDLGAAPMPYLEACVGSSQKGW